eukprot:m51a1_g2972 hypothetical protein (467) ;mRNA; r:703522-705744
MEHATVLKLVTISRGRRKMRPTDSILVAALALVCVSHALSTDHWFVADISITNSPSSKDQSGTMAYNYSETSTMRFAYFDLGDTKMLYDFKSMSRYIRTKKECTADIYAADLFRLFVTSSDSATGKTDGDCKQYQRSSDPEGISLLWVDDESHVCKVEFTDGTRWKFSNWATKPDGTTNVPPGSWDCPAATCKGVLDIVVIIDDSGSVKSEWANAIDFSTSLVNSFDVSDKGANFGFVQFSTEARLLIALSNNKQDILDAITGSASEGGATCIGCALKTGAELFKNQLPRPKSVKTVPKKIAVLITDGANNWPGNGRTPSAQSQAYLNNSVPVMRAVADLVVGIGIGDYHKDDLQLLATNDSYIFDVNSWAQLRTLLSTLISVACPKPSVYHFNSVAAAIAGGIIAAIIIAAVVGVLIFLSVSAYTAYKLGLIDKLSKNMSAQNNPLHRGNDREAVNPAYAGGGAE